MSGRIFPLNASEHAAVDALLPWYVNGTLRGEELDRVEQHVQACPACRREVDWLKDVFSACAAMVPLPEVSGPYAEHAAPAAPQPAHPRTRRARAGDGWRSSPPWMRMLMAAQLAGLVIVGSMLASNLTTGAGTQPSFRTLGSAASPASSGEAIAVMFDPAITEADLRRLVTEIGGRIVDGPTTTHAFVVEVPSARAKDALEKLRAEPSVRLAEPLGARATP